MATVFTHTQPSTNPTRTFCCSSRCLRASSFCFFSFCCRRFSARALVPADAFFFFRPIVRHTGSTKAKVGSQSVADKSNGSERRRLSNGLDVTLYTDDVTQ